MIKIDCVQIVMCRHGLPSPYEQPRAFARGQSANATSIRGFVETLDRPAEDRQRVLDMTPGSYTGLASTPVSAI